MTNCREWVGGRGTRMLVAVLMMVLARSAVAQTAPAGNEHPASQGVSQEAGRLPNPFGEPGGRESVRSTAAEKDAFAQAVDLSPLRGASVFHNGRVKVLDTLAGETVRRVTGRRNYREEIGATESASGTIASKQVGHDPLFTLLDLTIDPAYYVDRPLIGIEYLPLRRELLSREHEADAEALERALRSGRVSPVAVDRHAAEIARAHPGEAPVARALAAMDESMRLYLGGRANLRLAAPASRDEAWSLLTELPEGSGARLAAERLGAAWRARDAAGASAAAAALASELLAIHPEVQSASRRSLELAYNRVNAFEWGYWAYVASLIALLLAFGTGRRGLSRLGTGLLVGAVVLHAFGFIARCIIAERFAIQNQFESMTGLSLFAALTGGALMIVRRQPLFGAAAAAVGFIVLITATQTAIPGRFIEREAAILNTSVLLKYHVTTVLVSYGLISLGCVVSLFYLGTHYMGRARAAEGAAEIGGGGGVAAMALGGDGDGGGRDAPDAPSAARARTLADLDTAQLIVLQLAFWTLAVGILLGAWWADHSWGRWWAFDPKETWALLTWIIYLVVIHMRLAAPGRKGLVTAWLSVVGFVVMLWTYFGVNLLLPGLHAYA